MFDPNFPPANEWAYVEDMNAQLNALNDCDNPGDGPIPRFTGRSSGSELHAFAIDGAGITGNMGNPATLQVIVPPP